MGAEQKIHENFGKLPARLKACERRKGILSEMAEAELSELEQAVLRVERGWWKVADTREAAIRKLTGFSESQYYLLLSALLDERRFWRADPVLVDRLRRLREQKLAERAGSAK